MFKRFWQRRLAAVITTLIAVLAVIWMDQRQRTQLGHAAFFTGYVLVAAVVFLAAFYLRKRLNFIPIGTASGWMQLHIYVGLGAVAVFGLHTGFRLPTGVLESALYTTFSLTGISGLLGLYWTRTIPPRLTKLREQPVFEQLPHIRRQVERQAHQTVLRIAREAPAAAITDWYTQRLVHFFVRPRGWLYCLVPTGRLRNALQHELGALQRYFSESERAAALDLRRLIDRRDDLDYHDAQQRRLKGWLFLHLALTVVLLVLTATHVVMAHAFSGWQP